MKRLLIRNTLLAAPTALALTAPAAEAAQSLNKTAERQIQTLGKSVLALHDGKRTVTLSKDKQGRPTATVGLKVETGSAGQGSTTGNYSFRLVTAAKDGHPQPQEPRSLQITAKSQGAGGAEDRIKVEYHRDPRTHDWEVQVDNEHQGPSSSPSPNISLGGAYWEDYIHAAVHPNNPAEPQATPTLLKEVFKLADLAIQTATKGEPISDTPHQLPLN